jgi:hypothetical protein
MEGIKIHCAIGMGAEYSKVVFILTYSYLEEMFLDVSFHF